MRKLFDWLSRPAFAYYKAKGMDAFALACSTIVALTLVACLTLPVAQSAGLVVVAAVLTGYMYFAGVYFRFRLLEIGEKFLTRAEAGDWGFSEAELAHQWRGQGAVAIVFGYTDRVKQVAEQIAMTAANLQRNSKVASEEAKHLCTRAEEIAAMLEQTSAGLEQFTSSINQNAQRCAQVKHLAQQSTTAARIGVDEMLSINKSVRDTEHKPREIMKIIADTVPPPPA